MRATPIPVRFRLFDFGGSPIAYYLAAPVPLDVSAAAPQAPRHGIFIVDRSGSMAWDLEPLKAMLEKVYSVDEFKNPQLRVTLISYSGAGDVVAHFSRVPIIDVMAPGSPHLKALRAIQPTGLTCISQGLAMASTLVRDDEDTVISLHSDGWANDRSPTDERKKLDAIVATLRGRTRCTVNCIAYRDSSDFSLLASVANACSGSCVQARTIAQVYEALASSARVIAGDVAPAIDLDAQGADRVLFLSTTAQKCLGVAAGLQVRGLAPDDERAAWRLRSVTAAAWRKLKCPDATEPDGDLRPMLVLSRSLLGEGNLTRAKYAMASTRLGSLTQRHARALTAPQVAAMASDLDAVLYGDPLLSTHPDGGDTVVAPMHYDGPGYCRFVAEPGAQRDDAADKSAGYGVLDVAEAIGRHPKGLLVNVPALSAVYKRRGIQRALGTRGADGVLVPPAAVTCRRDDGPWTEVLGADVSNSAATINLLTSRTVDLVDRDTGARVSEVAGVKIDGVRTYNNYTLVGDGELNIDALPCRVVNKELHAELLSLGVVVGPFDPAAERVLRLRQLPLVNPADTTGKPSAGAVGRLLRLTVLHKLLQACRRGDPGRFSAEQAAELKRYHLTPALYYSPPSTTPYVDRDKAIATGQIDSRTGYTVAIGSVDVLSPDDLYSGNEYLQRRFAICDPAGATLPKPTMLDALAAAPGAVAVKALTARTKLNAVDDVTFPIYVAFLDALAPGVHKVPGEAEPSLEHLLRTDVGVRAADAKRAVAELAEPTTRANAIAVLLDPVADAVENVWRVFRPLVFFVGASGVVPESLEAIARDADSMTAAHPKLTLTKAQREGTFFECASGVVISVYATTEWYSTGRGETPGAMAAPMPAA